MPCWYCMKFAEITTLAKTLVYGTCLTVYYLLLVDVVPPAGSVVNFSDAEDLLNDMELV